MNSYISESLPAALKLLGKKRESCIAVRRVYPLLERIRKEGVFDARRRGRSPITALALKAQFEELARRIRRHRSTCKTCHNYLTRFVGKTPREIPIFLPGET